MAFFFILVICFHLLKQHGTSYGYQLIKVQAIVKSKYLLSTSWCKKELFKMFTKNTSTWPKPKSLEIKLTPNLFSDVSALLQETVSQIDWEQRCYSHRGATINAFPLFQVCRTGSRNYLLVSEVIPSYKAVGRFAPCQLSTHLSFIWGWKSIRLCLLWIPFTKRMFKRPLVPWWNSAFLVYSIHCECLLSWKHFPF